MRVERDRIGLGTTGRPEDRERASQPRRLLGGVSVLLRRFGEQEVRARISGLIERLTGAASTKAAEPARKAATVTPPLALFSVQTALKQSADNVTLTEISDRVLSEIFPPALAERHRCPTSDGGDDWLKMIVATIQRRSPERAGDLQYRSLQGFEYLLDAGERTAYFETADLGMRRLEGGPTLETGMNASSRPVGDAIVEIMKENPDLEELRISMGGSTWTDGGFGALQAFGYRFFDERGAEIREPIGARHLERITRVERPTKDVALPKRVMLVVDVDVPYRASAENYGKQKGIESAEVRSRLGDRMESIVTELIAPQLDVSRDWIRLPGSGAAGGLGGALQLAIPNAEVVLGGKWSTAYTGLEEMLESAVEKGQTPVLFFSEGKTDPTSLQGKIFGTVLELAEKYGAYLIAVPALSEIADPAGLYPRLVIHPFFQEDRAPIPADLEPEVALPRFTAGMQSAAESIRDVIRRERPELFQESLFDLQLRVKCDR